MGKAPTVNRLIAGKLVLTYWYKRAITGGWKNIDVAPKTGEWRSGKIASAELAKSGTLSREELTRRLEAAREKNPEVVGSSHCPRRRREQVIDIIIDSSNNLPMSTPTTPPSDQILEHEVEGSYQHLWREVILSYRKLVRQVAWHTQFTGAQFEVLRQLAVENGTSTVSALARDLAIDPAAVTRICADLVRLGLVKRESDANDGRRKPVVLTDEGRRQMADLHAQLHERESALTEGELDAAAIETAIRVLRTMRAGVDSIPLRP